MFGKYVVLALQLLLRSTSRAHAPRLSGMTKGEVGYTQHNQLLGKRTELFSVQRRSRLRMNPLTS